MQRRIGTLAHFVEEQHMVAIPPNEQGLGASAWHRPGLQGGKEEGVGVDLQQNAADPPFFPIIAKYQRHHNVGMDQAEIRMRMQVGHVGTPGAESHFLC